MKNIYFKSLRTTTAGRIWLGLLLLLFASSIGTTDLNAQVSGYIFSQSNGSYSATTGGTVLGTATANSGAIASLDTVSYPVTIPFGFVFNGQTYTDLNMSSNGYITFGTGLATGSTPISSTTTYDGAISAWGRDNNAVFDILGKTGNMSFAIEGTAPNRVAVMQWENFRPTYLSSPTAAYVFSFQIRLAETTNVISIVYSVGSYLLGNNPYFATNTQIGLRGATNADYNNRYNPSTVAFGSSTIGTANSNGQSFNTITDPPGMPTPGLTYTWTPPTCIVPSSLSVSNITTNSATLDWTASTSAPANGYDIYYSMSSVAPVSTTIPTIAGVTGLSQNLTALTPASTYYVWIRSVCSTTDASNWKALPTLRTACGPINYMFENFDSYAAGGVVPNCWDRIVSGSGTQTISATGALSPLNNIYQNSDTPASQTIVVLPVFSNINAGTHWLRLKARVTFAPRIIHFGYVTNATDANSFVLLEAKIITNTAYASPDAEYTFAVPASVPANARLAIKNPGTQATTLYYDDVYWEAAPTCLPPSNVAGVATSPTTANITWTASTTVPGNGYQIYYSTSSTPPTAATTPNVTNVNGLSATISSLAPTAIYYVWVRSSCTVSDISSWSIMGSFTTPCLPPSILSTTPGTFCAGQTATLAATADAGATIKWYAAATGGNELATGSSFTTPTLVAPTSYYVSASSGVGIESVGPISPASLGTVSATNYPIGTYYQIFDVTIPTKLVSIDVFPPSSVSIGTTSAIEIRNNTGATLLSVPYTVAVNDGVTPQTVTLNYTILPGTGYRIGQGQGAEINLQRNTSGAVYPFNSSAITITGNNFDPTYWYYIYNWKFSSSCESIRQQVDAVLDPSCPLSVENINLDEIDLTVYPNPVSSILYLKSKQKVNNVEIFSAAGTRVMNSKDKNITSVNMEGLTTGVYMVNITLSNGQVVTKKVIKK